MRQETAIDVLEYLREDEGAGAICASVVVVVGIAPRLKIYRLIKIYG